MPSWSRTAPLSHLAMNLGHAIKLADPVAAEKLFQEKGPTWSQDASAVKRWAEGVVPLWPSLAIKVARACPATQRARLWVLLSQSHPEHPVTMKLCRSVNAGERILAAVQAQAVSLVRAEVNAPTFKRRPPTARSLQEAMLTAIETDQADVVKLLLPSVSMDDTRYVNAAISRPGHPLWPLFSPHLSTSGWYSGWYEAAAQAIRCGSTPGKTLDVLEEALTHLRDTAHAVWVERLDRLLSLSIWCSSEQAQRVLRSHLGPDDLAPQSLEAARRRGHDALVSALLPRSDAGWEAWRRKLVRGSQACWDQVDGLVDMAPAHVQQDWAKRYGAKLPQIQARLRAEKAADRGPKTSPSRPRIRS